MSSGYFVPKSGVGRGMFLFPLYQESLKSQTGFCWIMLSFCFTRLQNKAASRPVTIEIGSDLLYDVDGTGAHKRTGGEDCDLQRSGAAGDALYQWKHHR